MRKFISSIILMVAASVATADIIPGVSSQLAPPEHQTVVWQKTPIAFSVQVGAERLLTFPTYLTLNNRSPRLTRDKVTIINNNGTLYIRAKKTFAPIRLYVTLHTGEVVLVDIAGVAKGDNTPVQVVLPKPLLPKGERPTFSRSASAVTLMRYAIQQLYAPMRLLHENPAIRRTPMYTSRSVRLINGPLVLALPQISWQSGGLFVTAVLVKNTRPVRVHLSPNQLYGNWQAVSFYPLTTLGKRGTVYDRTTVFLLSATPFNTALNRSQEVM